MSNTEVHRLTIVNKINGLRTEMMTDTRGLQVVPKWYMMAHHKPGEPVDMDVYVNGHKKTLDAAGRITGSLDNLVGSSEKYFVVNEDDQE